MGEPIPRDRSLTVHHGSLSLRIQLTEFDERSGKLRPERVPGLKARWSSRYPWLSEGALENVVREAEEAFLDRRKAMASSALPGYAQAKDPERRRHELIKALLKDPEDSKAWYSLGELLMKEGQGDDGFKAMGIGRRLANRGVKRTGR
jgi:hypothetical protein